VVRENEKIKPSKELDPLEKARRYCAYQERAQQEVRDKLYEWGCHQDEVENIITSLIGDDFLNEERFAKTYCRGKFRMKHWGKVKIKMALKMKRVSEPCINRGLKEIDPDEYIEVMNRLIEERARKTSERNPIKRNYKIANYILSRGFESDLVWDAINKLIQK
jgi:regulatory protein